jgi:hypothetical protein
VETHKNRTAGTSNAGVIRELLIGAFIGALIVGLAALLGPLLMDSDLSQNGLVQQLAKAEESSTAWNLLALPILMLIALAAYEIGHVVGGLSYGVRFLLLIVGPFGWHASVSGVRFE